MKIFEENDPAYLASSTEEKIAFLEEVLEDPGFNVDRVREAFPYLKRGGPAIAYLDNAATTQRPETVVSQLGDYYRFENANPLRGNHLLSVLSTQVYEEARETIQHFINAWEKEEIIYTRNTTEALNLVAYNWGLYKLQPGDQVLITAMEHHSNEVPWQWACQHSGAKLVYVELTDDFQLDMEDFERKLNDHTKVVAFTGASNVLSTMPDAKAIIRKAHEVGAIAVLDGAQLVPHETVDVQDLDCDFMAFSGHKMLGPFGVGVLYGKREHLENMPPFLYGGEMIEYVEDDHSTFAPLPYKFEAGTQNVGGAAGLAAAIRYINRLGMDRISNYERALGEYAALRLSQQTYIDLYHPLKGKRGSAVAFNVKDIHPHDVATVLDSYGIAIRSGHHCAQPLHRRLGISSSCRASFAFYNTKDEVEQLIDGLDKLRNMLGLDRED